MDRQQIIDLLSSSDFHILLTIFSGVALLTYAIGKFFIRSSPREEERLKQIHHDSPYNGEPETTLFGKWAPALAAQLPESEQETKEFRQMVRQAGMFEPQAAEKIYAFRFLMVALPLIAAGGCAVIFDSKWTGAILIGGLVTAIVLGIVPRLYVYWRRRDRVGRIRDGLPDVIDMLSMCVSGGLPLGASLEQVAKRMTSHPECAAELLLLKRQVELGGMRHALTEFVSRVDIPEASQLAALLARSNHLGTELVGSLSSQADHLRLARRQAALREANKTPVKLIFPIIFCFAPAVLILLSAPAIMQMHEYLTNGVPKLGQTAPSRDDMHKEYDALMGSVPKPDPSAAPEPVPKIAPPPHVGI
jgi:tight adherence protein C